MPRIAGIDIPNEKRIVVALTYIYGLGTSKVEGILKKAKVDVNIRAKNLTEEQISAINKAIVELNLPVEGELRRIVSQNIRRLIEIRSYRGSRHRVGLPTRGQRTRSNARTRKG
ncbi:30S ribosomal protein S13, partial [candidate division WWE3 bacterium RBG_13_37_7]